ncbi:MAG: aminomethyl-transferring glycine dehydrogenase subunit GcvPA [Thermoplasmata archaeon]|nr:aminomethyl-transferring glycine dehydrogenase subunit GcvPA [Thermoplasmata archaeon]
MLRHQKIYLGCVIYQRMKEMLNAIGIKSIDELFEFPDEIKCRIDLPSPMNEMDVEHEIVAMMEKNRTFYEMPSFLPILKPHYIPAIVDEIVARQEFYTSYTPYQAEASQGMLQALFEYQSIVAELTGMEVANASMYDGATALGEAALMANRIKKRGGIAIPECMYEAKKQVLKNYAKGVGIKIYEMPCYNGLPELKSHASIDAIYVENPNFYGIIERRQDEIIDAAEKSDALIIVGSDPLFLSIYNPPEYADIVIGEGYLGNYMNFGGPLLGIFACKRKYLRHMPGRIIGATVDKEGKRAFTMTLQTREQHIRRGKATSNICSNEALCAIAFLAYVAALGRNGLRRIALKNKENAHYMAKQLEKIGFELPFKDFFNEFLAISPVNASMLNKKLLEYGIQNGMLIEKPSNSILYGVTEMHSKELIDRAIEKIKMAMEALS